MRAGMPRAARVLPELGGRHGTLSLEPPRGTGPAHILIPDFCLQNWERMNLCCFKPPSGDNLFLQPQETGPGAWHFPTLVEMPRSHASSEAEGRLRQSSAYKLSGECRRRGPQTGQRSEVRRRLRGWNGVPRVVGGEAAGGQAGVIQLEGDQELKEAFWVKFLTFKMGGD